MAEPKPAAADKVARYVKWLQENGVQNLDAVEIVEYPGMGYGIKSKKDLDAKMVAKDGIISVPKKLWIGVNDTINHPVFNPIFTDRALSSKVGYIDLILALRIMYEKVHDSNSEGGGSFWAPWLEFLPDQFNSTVFWSDQDLSLIEGTNLYDTTKGHRSQIKRDYDDLFHKLFKKFPNTFHKRVYTLKLFEWALGAVWSHRIDTVNSDGIKNSYLIPLIDLFNHSNTSKLGYAFFNDNESVGVAGEQSVKAGEQIFVNYNKPNDALLHLYGFASDNNPLDQVEIYARMDPKATMYEHKMNLLKNAGISKPNGPYSLRAADLVQDFPMQVLGAIRIQNGTMMDLANYKLAFVRDKFLSLENELQSVRALHDGLSKMLSYIKGDHKEDLQKFITCLKPEERQKLSDNEFYALLLRLSDRKILMRALYHLSTHDAALAKLLQFLQGKMQEADQKAGGGSAPAQ